MKRRDKTTKRRGEGKESPTAELHAARSRHLFMSWLHIGLLHCVELVCTHTLPPNRDFRMTLVTAYRTRRRIDEQDRPRTCGNTVRRLSHQWHYTATNSTIRVLQSAAQTEVPTAVISVTPQSGGESKSKSHQEHNSSLASSTHPWSHCPLASHGAYCRTPVTTHIVSFLSVHV